MEQAWSALSAISTAIGALIVLAGGVYARSQVKEARFSRNVTLLIEFQRQYHSLEFREFRARLFRGEFGSPESFDLDSLSHSDQHRFAMLFDHLEFLGIMVERRLIEFDLVMSAFHASPLRVWNMVEPHVLKKRSKGRTLFGVHFEKLAQRYTKTLPDHYVKSLAYVNTLAPPNRGTVVTQSDYNSHEKLPPRPQHK